MVRRKNYKCIVHSNSGRKRYFLFDLSRDPFERENLAEDPGHSRILTELLKEIHRYFGGEQVEEKTYLEEYAPICGCPNARTAEPVHRDGMKTYFTAKMRAERKSAHE